MKLLFLFYNEKSETLVHIHSQHVGQVLRSITLLKSSQYCHQALLLMHYLCAWFSNLSVHQHPTEDVLQHRLMGHASKFLIQ